MATAPSHLTCHIADFYPISHFEQLSKRVLNKTSNKKSARHHPHKVVASPREEIYKSMCREIQNAEATNMNSLVHKASGILKLTHFDEINKTKKPTVSWDIDGRRVLKYDYDGAQQPNSRIKSALPPEINWETSFRKKSLILDSVQEPVYGLEGFMMQDTNNNVEFGAEGETRCELTKLWEDYINTGDVSKLWESKDEEILSKSSRHSSTASVSSVLSESTSMMSTSSAATTRSQRRNPLGKQKLWKSDSTIPSSYYISSSSIESKSSNSTKRKHSSRSSTTKPIKSKENRQRVDRVQHICVVNGSAVSFKDFGLENFSNWFGDEGLLEANLQRSQPKVHLELDLTDVLNKDIKIRLLDGYKLEVEARRKLKGTQKSLRLKETLLLPKGYTAEDLLMCRTKTGKLIVEDVTTEPIRISTSAIRTKSKGRRTKDKSQKQWRI